ncbi:MAG: hypothetical protein ACRDGU_02080 [Actinomycetota bacterium]
MDVGDSSVSRRGALKRIGAGTAIAWSAPILSSLRTPAYAQYPPTCEPGQDSCAGGDFNCNGLARCFCTGTAEGGQICGCFDRGGCEGYTLCDSTSDCPAGEFCTTTGTLDCCNGICVPLCHAGCGGGQPAGAGARAGEPPAAT